MPAAPRSPSPVELPVRSGFVRTEDGVDLYWKAVGAGPVIACCNGVGVSTFFWKYFVDHFAQRATVVVWDYRGHGRSSRRIDPLSADLSIARHAADLIAVLDAVGATEPALLVGHSMGCQVILEATRRHPERAAGLVLLLGTAGRALHTFYDTALSVPIFKVLRAVTFRAGEGANRLLRPLLESPLTWTLATGLRWVDPYYTRPEDLAHYTRHMAGLDQRLFMQCVAETDAHDAWGALPNIGVPVLVVAAELDVFTPLWCSQKIARTIPGAELFQLADATHAALVEQPDTIHHRVERFLSERLPRVYGAAA